MVKTKWTKQMDKKLVKMYKVGEKKEKIAKEISRVSGKRITGHAVSGRIWRLKRGPNYAYLTQFRRISTKQKEKEILEEPSVEEEGTYTERCLLDEVKTTGILDHILEGVHDLQRKLREKIEIEEKGFEKVRVEIERIYLLLCHRFYGGIFNPGIIWDENTGSGANRIPGALPSRCYPTLHVYPEETPVEEEEEETDRYKVKPLEDEERRLTPPEKKRREMQIRRQTTNNICRNLEQACLGVHTCKHRTVTVHIHKENTEGNCWDRFIRCMDECKQKFGTELIIDYL